MRMTFRPLPVASFRLGALALACAVVAGCASVTPAALDRDTLASAVREDRRAMHKDVEPIAGPLTLDEAMARGLKYNLERRARMMEETLARGQLDVTRYDMLPRVMAQAGYASRDTARYTWSSTYPSEQPSSRDATSTSTSAERNHSTADLGLTWSVLDFGLGYYGARQQADRLLVAAEKRRKAMHLLMQDVRTAYWRAASAQLLRDDVARTIRLAEEALVDSQKVAEDRIRNPLDPLRYQRQLLENLRLLESIDQELASAQVDLASLISAPLGQPIRLAEMDLKNISDEIARVPVAHLEETALMRNADLLEQHYNSRIARTETRRALLRLFPNLSFNYALKYDSDTYQLHRNWNEAGAQLSFNLMGLFSGPAQIRLAEAGVALADQRRVATQLGVLTQVHLSRLQVINARSQFDRADAIYSTDKKIADLMRNRQAAQAQSKLDMVSAETAAILSLLRRYQALAQVQVAENRLIATLGLEPAIGNTQELPLKELVMQLGKSPAPWSALMNRPEAAAPAAPQVQAAGAAAPAAVAARATPGQW